MLKQVQQKKLINHVKKSFTYRFKTVTIFKTLLILILFYVHWIDNMFVHYTEILAVCSVLG